MKLVSGHIQSEDKEKLVDQVDFYAKIILYDLHFLFLPELSPKIDNPKCRKT